MKKNKKGEENNKRRLYFKLALNYTAWCACFAVGGYFLYSHYKDDIKWYLNRDDLNRFLNNNKVIEQQDEDYEPDDISDELETIEPEEEVEVVEQQEEQQDNNQETVSISYPEIIPETDFERTSSELYDIWDDIKIPNVDWKDLNETNKEANAWLYIPGIGWGTGLSLPIVQGNDNEYYLDHDIEGKEDKLGTLFIDYRDNPMDSEMKELSDVTTVYGHNMKSGAMFASICNYKSPKTYERHPYGVVMAENGEVYKLDFFAGVRVDGNDATNVYATDFIDEGSFKAYFDNIISNSTFESNCDIQYGDKIMALSTCSYGYTNSRFVLYGRLTKQIEKEEEVQSALSK